MDLDIFRNMKYYVMYLYCTTLIARLEAEIEEKAFSKATKPKFLKLDFFVLCDPYFPTVIGTGTAIILILCITIRTASTVQVRYS